MKTTPDGAADGSPSASRDAVEGGLALVLTGGGARAAYQVGFLRALGRRYPDLPVQIITGVSAGAINAAFLASRSGDLDCQTEDLVRIWRSISPEGVFRIGAFDLTSNVLRWSLRLISGGRLRGRKTRGMLDTTPLRDLLERELSDESGRITGIDERLAKGPLRAVAITTTSYTTGQTVTWFDGRDTPTWERTHRISRHCSLHADHVMASCSIPFVFPAAEIDGRWYGDGGIRLYAPLSPAVRLGATKILALSTRYARSPEEAGRPSISGYPPPAHVGGVLFNAIFLDVLDADAERMDRLTRLLEMVPDAPEHNGIRPIDLRVIRPSQDLGMLASEFEVKLPRTLRFLTRGLGTKETRSADFLSLLMFQPDYLSRLIALGEQDFDRQSDEMDTFLAD